MFGLNGNGFTIFEVNSVLGSHLFILILCILACTPVVKYLSAALENLGRRWAPVGAVNSLLRIACPILLLVLSTAALVGNSYNPFLYFQF